MHTDGRRLLFGNLISCFPKQAEQINNRWTAIANELLPAAMTAEQAWLLTRRLVIRCRFLPAIAEIVEEWQHMAREERMREHVPTAGEPGMAKVCAMYVRRLRQDMADGKPCPKPVIPPGVVEFARTFFPEISDSLIQRNWLEIITCMRDREKEQRRHSVYRTVMCMCPDGTIELVMGRE